MSLKKKLGALLLFGTLQIGRLMGVPMTPEDIEKIMNVMHRTKVVYILKQEDEDEDRQSRARDR